MSETTKMTPYQPKATYDSGLKNKTKKLHRTLLGKSEYRLDVR